MKVLITAGGTTEPIDSVRSITNTSTGKLGSTIAKAYETISDISKIYYICGSNSIFPKSEKVEVIFVNTVASLEDAVRKVIQEDTIDIIIHSMAVSDYRVKTVTSSSMLTNNLKSKANLLNDTLQHANNDFVTSQFHDSETILNNEGKIPSNINDLIICMEQTPKIISLFQKIAPQATLVGFKLLDNVQHDVLINTAFQVLQLNKCSFVLANDLRDVSSERHIGYLIDEFKNCTQCTTKKEIADAIVKATLNKRSK